MLLPRNESKSLVPRQPPPTPNRLNFWMIQDQITSKINRQTLLLLQALRWVRCFFQQRQLNKVKQTSKTNLKLVKNKASRRIYVSIHVLYLQQILILAQGEFLIFNQLIRLLQILCSFVLIVYLDFRLFQSNSRNYNYSLNIPPGQSRTKSNKQSIKID